MFTIAIYVSTNVTVTKLNRLAELTSEIGRFGYRLKYPILWQPHQALVFHAERQQSLVRAAMFKGSNRNVRIRPKEGDKILVRKLSVGLYEARGDYQLVVEHMGDGEGVLASVHQS